MCPVLPLKTSRSEQKLKAEKEEEVIKIIVTSRMRAKVIKLHGNTVVVT
jgi:hypothetical protein